MKFSGSFSALLVVLPLLLQAAALPNRARAGSGGFGQGSRFNFGGNNNQNANNKNNNNAVNNKNNGQAAGQNNSNANNANTANTSSTASSSQNSNNAASQSGNNNNNDANPQTSLELDPSLIGPNIALNGLNGTGSEAGQAPSLTSTNNFINFCLGKTITNGLQVKGGSCNPIPMGDMPANTVQPSCKFVSPVNGQNIAPNTSFTVQMAIQNLDTGFFVNPNTNYFGAPQQLVNGVIQGHSHIVIQPIKSFTDTSVVNPQTFSFFQGLNAAAQNGVLSATVTSGLPDGIYKVSSINTASNHQPVLGPVAQHGSFDDAVYISVGSAGGDSPFGGSAASGAAASGTGVSEAANNGANAAGAANNGAKNTGAANTGAANSGAKNTGAANSGAKNTGAANSGAANNGAKNTGAANNGAKNTGAANAGAKNTGAANHGGAQQGQKGKGRRSFNIARQD